MIEMLPNYMTYDKLCDRCDCYLEIPFDWIPMLECFFDDCEKCLAIYGMKLSDVEFVQVKEKYSTLRIDYCMKGYYDCTDEEQIRLNFLNGLIGLLVFKYEVVIKNFVNEQREMETDNVISKFE